jgi:hypothetical protein
MNLTITREQADKFRSVVNYIRERGRALRFDMGEWARFRESCGTVCCFAGFIAEKEGVLPKMDASRWYSDGKALSFTTTGIPIYRFAQEYLGFGTGCEAVDERTNRIFFVGDWPSPFKDDYYRAEARGDDARKVEILSDRIEHLIETGY